jgi:hypothetical protein
MTDKIQQARRAAFEAAYEPEIHRIAASYGAIKADTLRVYRMDDGGAYKSRTVQAAWLGFSAALDCVVIELPADCKLSRDGLDEGYFAGQMRDDILSAIESTNLGIKIK